MFGLNEGFGPLSGSITDIQGSSANPITNSKFAEQYATNNKANEIFCFTHLVKMLDKDMCELQLYSYI